MPDLTPPIEVKESTGAIDATAATFRYIVVTGLTYAVAKGWIDASNLEGIASFVVIVATAGYGLLKTFRRGKQIATAAEDPRNQNIHIVD